jgi:hypothetical protein
MHLRMLPDHQTHGLEKDIFSVSSGKKRVLMHFRIFPDHQKHVLKKDVFLASGLVKNVF